MLFENLTKKGYGLITYQKGNYDKIDEDKFKKINENNYKKTISIGAKDYKHLPFEQEVILRINEKKDNAFNKRPGSRDTKRTIAMRDIRILCKDGHQVSILANKNVKVSAVEIADIMFNRIGSQENIFKYMREEFDVDGLVSYKFEDVDENTFHPNPQWIKQEKKIAKLRKKEMKLLAKISKKMIFEESTFIKETIDDFSEKDTVFLLNKINDLPNEITKKEGAKILKNLKLPSTLKEKFVVDIFKELKASNINTREALIKILKEVIVIKTLTQDEILGKLKILKEYEYANEILELNKKIKMEKKILDKINFKENAQKNGYQKPKAEPKRLMNIVKMAAYAIETKLFDILAKHYKYNKNDGRALLKSAFKSTGSLKLKPGEIVIKLDEQATPQRTRAINSLIDELSAKNVQFPGSQRIIRFEQTKIKNT